MAAPWPRRRLADALGNEVGQLPIEAAVSLTAVGKELSLLWDLRTALGDTTTLRWDIHSALGDQFQALWDQRFALGKQVQLLWEIHGDAPIVKSVTTTAIGANSTTWAINMPATVDPGDLLVLLLGSDASTDIDSLSGWERIRSSSGAASRLSVFAKRAIGNEDGTTVTVTFASAECGAGHVYRIINYSGLPSSPGVSSTVSSGNVNPPIAAPNWGTRDQLFIIAIAADTDTGVSAYSTGYTDNQTATPSGAGDADGATLVSATKTSLNSASDDPANTTLSDSISTVVTTLALRGPVKYDDIGFTRFFSLSGSAVTTPDHADLDITGDLDVRFLFLVDQTGGTEGLGVTRHQNIITKGNPGDAAGSWVIRQSAGGTNFQISWREAGGTIRTASGSPSSVPRGTYIWGRVVLDVDNGSGQYDAHFYTSTEAPTTDEDSVTWSLVNTVTGSTGPTSINSSTSDVYLGNRSDLPNERLGGDIAYAEVRNGIDGTKVLNVDFRTRDQYVHDHEAQDDFRTWTISDPAKWYVPAESPFTAVGDSISLLWDLRAAVGDTSTLRWDIRAAIGDAVQALWDVRTPIGDQFQAIWDQRLALGDTVQALWDVRAALGDTTTLRWDIFRVAPLPVPPSFRAIGNYANAANAVVVQIPVGTVVDDILLLLVETANQAVTVSNPNGGTWTEVPDSPQGIGTAGAAGAFRLTVFWSRYNGTQGDPTIGDSGDHQTAVIMAIPGCIRTGSPIHVSNGATVAPFDTGFSAAVPTTTVDGCLIVTMVAGDQDVATSDYFTDWANSSLTDVNERADRFFSGANGGGVGAVTGVKAIAGASVNTTATKGGTAGYAHISLALLPQPPGQISLPWDIRAALGDTVTLRWDISGAVGDQFQALWDIYTALGDSVELQWDVFAANAIGDEVQLLWDIRTAIGDTAQLLWDISGAVGDQVALQWDVRTPVGDQIALLWDLVAPLGDTTALQWDVHVTVGDTIALLWDILRDYVYLRPVATLENDGWDSGPTTGLDLWAQIDEATADDDDYITNAV